MVLSFALMLVLVLVLVLVLAQTLALAKEQTDTPADGSGSDVNQKDWKLVLIALDSAGMRGAAQFASFVAGQRHKALTTKVFSRPETVRSLPQAEQAALAALAAELVEFAPRWPLEIGMERDRGSAEFVTFILETIDATLGDLGAQQRVLFVALGGSSIPQPSATFFDIFDRLDRADLTLLEKTRRLSSVSDWHDLSLVGLTARRPPALLDWLEALRRSFETLAHRQVYGLPEPRPAILEASLQLRERLSIAYWSSESVCSTSVPWALHAMQLGNGVSVGTAANSVPNPFALSKCRTLFDGRSSAPDLASIEFYCGLETLNQTRDVKMVQKMIGSCLNLHVSRLWHRRVDHNMPWRFPDTFVDTDPERFDTNVMEGLYFGVLRFRNSSDLVHPRPFCWDPAAHPTTESGLEYFSTSKIVNGLHDQPPFHHDPSKFRRARHNVAILTGTSGNAFSLNRFMYMSISKQYFARRHNYSFEVLTSNEYVEYFPPDLFNSLSNPLVQPTYFAGIMTKALMVLDSMFRHPDREWVLWTDDDTYINPGWLYMNLDAFLDRVPPDKVFVASNFRSALTNIFFVRNSEQGRRLVLDWLAVTMSGRIQCHGYDQAALETLVLLRLLGEFTPDPLGFTCTYSQSGNTGCNSKGDYSCDFKFEQALYQAGFKTKYVDYFYGGKYSSYSKGCANDFFPDFHILRETAEAPRFQCGICSRLSEIETAGHWDGPLGGGNDLIQRGAVNGWFFNHKAEFLFYEAYLDPSHCQQMPELIADCPESTIRSDKSSKIEIEATHGGRFVLSLADDLAFDFDGRTYCRVRNSEIRKHQRERTYMKEYTKLIARINQISDADWKQAYQAFESEISPGRKACSDCHRHPEDGMEKRVFARESDLIEEADFCQRCRKVAKHEYARGAALDCRSEEEQQREEMASINQ